MLGTLFDWVRDYPEKLRCKTCDYETLFAIGMIKHLKKCHNTKITKKDLRFLLKYNYVSRLIKCLVAFALIPPIFVIKFILCLLGMIGENL